MSTAENQSAHYPDVAGGEGHNEAQLADNGGAQPVEGGNIDKIRDILFGGQMRDYERRFTRLEERLMKESTDLRDDTRRRFDALEAFIKHELEELGERLQTEQRTRDESVQDVARGLKDTGQGLERKLKQFDEQTTRSQRDLRQQLLPLVLGNAGPGPRSPLKFDARARIQETNHYREKEEPGRLQRTHRCLH